MYINGSENILFNAINAVDDQNGEQEITYIPNNEGLLWGRINGPVTERVKHLGNRLYRSFFGIMTSEDVAIAIPNVNDFVHDVNVLYYNSPTHGIVRIYFHETWVFHSWIYLPLAQD
jgi:hypothetical protein